MGARQIDLETRDGSAEFYWVDARNIDPEAIRRAAADANYTLTGLSIFLRGRWDQQRFLIEATGEAWPLASASLPAETTQAPGGTKSIDTKTVDTKTVDHHWLEFDPTQVPMRSVRVRGKD